MEYLKEFNDFKAQHEISELKLKKGDTVWEFGSWNGSEKPTIKIYLQKYTVFSSGKKRTYLLVDDDTNSKKAYWSGYNYNFLRGDVPLEDAIKIAREYGFKYIEEEIKQYEIRIERNPNSRGYTDLMKSKLDNLKNIKDVQVVVNPYSKKK